MIKTTYELDPIRYSTGFSYAKKAPSFISNNMGGADEIARWALDRNDILYHDEPHAPPFCNTIANRLTGANGPGNHPVLVRTDALIYSTDSIIQYIERHCPPCRRLIPDDPAKRKEVLVLYSLFAGEFEDMVSQYVYSKLLPSPALARALFTQRVPSEERLIYKMSYSSVRQALTRDYALGADPQEKIEKGIREIFDKVDALLGDGRKYLCGPTLTLADIAFAAVGAPLVLPEEFGGAMCRINQVSEGWRNEVFAYRTTAAGQFILRLYQEDRPPMRPQKDLPREPNVFGRMGGQIGLMMARRKTGLFSWLQKRFPILKLWPTKLVTVNKNDLLVELMERDEDFTIEEINGRKMARQKGAFFLGMDRMNPQFDRERNLIRRSAKREDLETIRGYIRSSAEEILSHAQVHGKIDVADSLCRVVLVRFIGHYFGVPGPTEDIMKNWLRALFYDLFLNFTNNAAKHQAAVNAADERKAWLIQLIRDRKQAERDGIRLEDNVLNRLILLQREPGNEWFDDDMLQRNMGGLITGILETTNKAVILVLDELFNRPDALKGAIACAQQKDMKRMYGYVSEALRFNPAQPGVIRYSERQHTLKGKGQKEYTIPAKSVVFALTAAAMMDPAAFPDPRRFDPERDAVYMNYGYALHECYGKYINAVTISEFVAAVLRLPDVHREPGRAGRGTGLQEGPFPNNFVVAFSIIN